MTIAHFTKKESKNNSRRKKALNQHLKPQDIPSRNNGMNPPV